MHYGPLSHIDKAIMTLCFWVTFIQIQLLWKPLPHLDITHYAENDYDIAFLSAPQSNWRGLIMEYVHHVTSYLNHVKKYCDDSSTHPHLVYLT
jgi:hypothetical protein